MTSSLAFSVNCYTWGHTNFFFDSHLHDRYRLLRIFNRCVFVFVVSAVVAPIGCLYLTFKAIHLKLRGMSIEASRHFHSAIQDLFSFTFGALMPVVAGTFLIRGTPVLINALKRDELSGSIEGLHDLFMAIVFGFYSLPTIGAFDDLKFVGFFVIGGDFYITYLFHRILSRSWAWRDLLPF